MQTGISTASFYNICCLEDIPPRIAAFGATLTEVFLNTFSEYEEDFIYLLKDRLQQHQLQTYSIHPMGTQFEAQLFSMHPRQRADAFKIFEQVLKAGAFLQAQHYIMHGPMGQFGYVKNMEFERLGPITRDLCALAKEYHMNIAWENVSWCLFSFPEFSMRLMDAMRCDDLRFTLDIKQAARSGYSPLQYIQAIQEYCVNVHVCDYIIHNGRVIPRLPGQGECDFNAVKAALQTLHYQGPAILEVYSDLYNNEEELKRCYQWTTEAFQ